MKDRSLLIHGMLAVAILVSGCATAASRVDESPARTEETELMTSPFETIIPLPASIEILDEPSYRITSETRVVATNGDEELHRIASWLADHLDVPLATEEVARASDIRLVLDEHSETGGEGYELKVGSGGVELRASSSAGIFYGVQSLRQILPPALEYESALVGEPLQIVIPAARVRDQPRFLWRGAMLDVARHFFGVDDVKRYLDLMSLYKLNRLHLHLADDQGWRIQIDAYPALTEIGAETEVGGTPGGFYTKKQFREIVDYAAERFITVVPEIDLPGHTNAALASVPELNCDGVAPEPYTGIQVGFSVVCVGNEFTWRFIDEVVGEITEMAPGGYFHVGGDEVKKLGEEAYAAFVERVQGVVSSHDAATIGWDEIAVADLLPSTIIQHWRPGSFPAEAAGRGTRVIFSPADRMYLDMKYDDATAIGQVWAAKIPVRRSYEWDPTTIAANVPEGSILGVEAPLWTETIGNIRDLEFMAFPRLTAAAEVGWTPLERRSWDRFRLRLAKHSPRWTVLGVNFHRSADVPWE